MQPSCVAFKSMCKKVEDNSQDMAAIANEFHKFICINIVTVISWLPPLISQLFF